MTDRARHDAATDTETTTDDADPWPRDLRGVTETVVGTRGPNDRWNHAALGIHAPATTDFDDPVAVAAYTYGRTRTWRNFHDRGEGVVQFTVDSVDFTDAALDVLETDQHVLESADAWVVVETTQVDAREESDGTRVERWRLDPVEVTVSDRVVPVVNRGHAAVVDATVAASRLGLDGFDDGALHDRLDRAVDVVDTCGGSRERQAIHRVAALTDDWTPSTALPDLD
jgi:hypothetical protein